MCARVCVFTWAVSKGREEQKGGREGNLKSDFALQNRLPVVKDMITAALTELSRGSGAGGTL